MKSHLIVVGLLVCSGASAREAKGAPPELIGHWSESKEACRSYHRNTESMVESMVVTTIDQSSWTTCGAKGCYQGIVSHRRTRHGYVLKMTNAAMDQFWSTTVVVHGKNRIHERGEDYQQNLTRCMKEDAVAGIGLNLSAQPSDAEGMMFSALYALDLPSACPKLKIDTGLAEQLVQDAKAKLRTERQAKIAAQAEKPLWERGRVPEEPEPGDITSAISADAEEIPSFCERVRDAFGEHGRVLPNLVSVRTPGDTEKRADPAPAVIAGATLVATFKAWSVYAAQPGKARVCFALSHPTYRYPAAIDRAPGYFFVSSRPLEKVNNEVSLSMGFPLESRETLIAFGARRFPLAAKGLNAWIKNRADEPRLVEAMRVVGELEIQGSSPTGLRVSDSYSLDGFSEALDRVSQECR